MDGRTGGWILASKILKIKNQERTATEQAAMDAQTEREDIADYESFLWTEFLKALPTEVRGAIFLKDQRAQVEQQMNGKKGLDSKFLIAAIQSWVDERALPVDGGWDECKPLRDRWGAWLKECAPYIEAQRDDQRKARREARRTIHTRHVLALFPSVVAVCSQGGDFFPTDWIVVRRQCYGEGKHGRADVYATEEAARRDAANRPCKDTAGQPIVDGRCSADKHIVKTLAEIQRDYYASMVEEEE